MANECGRRSHGSLSEKNDVRGTRHGLDALRDLGCVLIEITSLEMLPCLLADGFDHLQ